MKDGLGNDGGQDGDGEKRTMIEKQISMFDQSYSGQNRITCKWLASLSNIFLWLHISIQNVVFFPPQHK